MARVRKSPAPQPEPQTDSVSAPVENTISENRSTTVRKPRIIIHCDPATGKPNLAALDASARSDLVSAIQSEAPAEPVDPALIGMVLTGLGSLEAAMLAARFDLDPERVKAIVGPHEPLDKLLAAAAAKVVSKHNLMGRWGDEIALLALLATWQAGVLQAVRGMRETKRAVNRDLGKTATGQVNTESRTRGDEQ